MEIHQVRYFVAVSQHLNFTRAAEACNVTQPALTKAIQKLEYEFGGELIFRERQLTQLTELGKLVLPMLENMLAAADAARSSARDFKHKVVAPLRIGLSPCVSATLIVNLLAEISVVVPGLQVELVETAPRDIARCLLDGELSAAFAGNTDVTANRIDRWPLFEERFVVLMPTDCPLARLPMAPISALKDQVWLERAGCDALQILWRGWFPGEADPRIHHRGRQEAHLHQMVAAGLGLLISPDHGPLAPGLSARPIERERLTHKVELMVIAGRQYTPALDALVKVSRSCDWGKALRQFPPFMPGKWDTLAAARDRSAAQHEMRAVA